MLQFRPRDASPNDPMYSPQRDIAVVVPGLLPYVAALYSDETWPAGLKSMAEVLGVTKEMLQQAAVTFTAACAQSVKAKTPIGLDRALKDAGFYVCNEYAQRILLIPLTEMLMAQFVSGYRQAARPNEPPLCSYDLACFIELTQQFLKDSGYTLPAELRAPDTVPALELKWQNEQLAAENQSLRDQVAQLQSQLEQLSQSNPPSPSDLPSLNSPSSPSGGVASSSPTEAASPT